MKIKALKELIKEFEPKIIKIDKDSITISSLDKISKILIIYINSKIFSYYSINSIYQQQIIIASNKELQEWVIELKKEFLKQMLVQ